MPRLSKSVPKYRKHSSGQAFVELSGRRIYLGPWKSKASRIEYDRHIGEWLQNNRRPAVVESEITVVELCGRFREWAEGYYIKNGKPTCLHRVKVAIQRARAHHGRIPAVEFTPLALKSIRQRMIDDGLSRAYINALIKIIVRMFKWGAAEDLGEGLAAVHEKLSKVSGLRCGKCEARETAPVLPVADSIVDATLDHLPPIVADMVRLQRLTGCRPEEVCRMRPDCIDTTGEVWAYRPESHKTQHKDRQRVIFIGPRGQDILRPYLLREKSAYCFSPREVVAKQRAERHEARKTPLSCGNVPGSNVQRKPRRSPGERYDTASYRRAIHRACELAFSMPKELRRKPKGESAEARKLREEKARQWRDAHTWAPNQLRHSAATEIRKRFGLEGAQVTLGHASAAITQVYAERDQAKAAEIMREVG